MITIEELLFLAFVLGIMAGIAVTMCGGAIVLSIHDRKREVRRLHNLRKVPK